MWFCWILKWRLTSIKLNVYAIPKQHRRKQNIEIYGAKAHHYKSFFSWRFMLSFAVFDQLFNLRVTSIEFPLTIPPLNQTSRLRDHQWSPIKHYSFLHDRTTQVAKLATSLANLVAKIFLLSPCRLNWLKLGALTTSQSTILGRVIQFKPSLSS